MLRFAHLALVAVFTMTLMGFFQTAAQAAVTVTNQFSTTPCDSDASGATTSNLACTTPTIGAGANRVLVLVVTGEAGGNHNPASTTATYGSASFTTIMNSDGNNDNRRYVWMGYINESQIAANAGSNIAATLTSNVNWAATQAQYAVYSGVNQGGGTATVPAAAEAGSAGTSTALSMGPIASVTGGAAIYAISANATTGNTTVPTNYTEHVDQVNTGAANYFVTIGSRVTTPGGTESIAATTVNNRWLAAFATLGVAPSDSTAPTAGTVTVTPESGSFVPADFSITTLFTENESAVSSCQYTINGSTWNAGTVTGSGPYTCSVSVTGASGALTVNMRATSAGGTGTATAINRTVDAAAPTTGAAPAGGIYTSDQSVTLTPTDAASGVASTVYCVDAVNSCVPGTAYSGAVNVAGVADTDVVRYLRFASTDNLGNAETVLSEIYTLNRAEAPAVTAFTIPATVVDTAAPLEIPVTTFTATDNVGVTGYMITESATAPGAGDAGWSGSAPAIYTVPSYNTYTLYAWAKDAAGNVSLSASATTTVSNCVEAGSVTVSISPDPGPSPSAITAAVTVNASVGGGASNPQVRWSTNGGADWSVWAAAPAVFTPPGAKFGTVLFEAQADGSCAGNIITSAQLNRDYDTRVDALDPSGAIAVQNGLAGIKVTFSYCSDKNSTGQFKVEWKLASSGIWAPADTVIALDGGANDDDGTRNEEVLVLISGLTGNETYDVRLTFIDVTDGLTGVNPSEVNQQVTLVSWSDSPLLHSALRFACSIPGYADQISCEGAGGTWSINRKYPAGWGTPGTEYGAILCSTCHTKNSGNIKRVTSAVASASGSFPGGAVTFTSAVDGSSDFGDDAGGHATSTKVCEACHSVTDVHRYDTTGQPGGTSHYNQADCTKCHEHKAGFRASCTACHGNPPLSAGELTGPLPGDDTGSTSWGAHSTHAETLGFVCNTCHTGWETNGQMPNVGNLNIGFVTPGADGGTYDGRNTGGGYTAGPSTTVLTTKASNTTTCALYCHGYGLPQWTTTAGTVTCGACHGEPGSYGDDRAGAPTGVAASRDLSGALTGFKVGKHANHLDDSLAATGDPCALCHSGFGYADATHVDGTLNVSLNAAAGASAAFAAGSPGTCSNLTCHGDAPWNSAASGGCDFCHGYPPTTTNNKHANGVQAVNHDSLNITPNHDQCTYCHGYKDNGSGTLLLLTGAQVTALKGTWTPTATAHQDGSVTMNGGPTAADAGYNATNGGCDSAACHVNDATHRVGPGNTTSTKLLVAIGPGSCGTCHDGGDPNAPVVTATSTHVFANGSSFGDCTDCHNGHANGTTGVNDVEISTVYTGTTAVPTMTETDGTTALYSGHSYKIQLGGTATSGYAKSTEAEICWACHDARGVSEWGTNSNADTGSINYNYGQLFTDASTVPGTATSNWTTGYWRSGKGLNSTLTSNPYWYKRGKVRSTHAANYDGTTATSDAAKSWKASLVNTASGYSTTYNKNENLDAAASIRCSYCHDVHGTHNGIKGDNSSTTALGGPYLRGTWLGNPYPEDGAPRFGMANFTIQSTNGTSTAYGIVPRASAISSNTGITAVAQVGGWWIDQNSGNPVENHANAAFRTATGNAGLCDQCHGTTKDGTWSAAEIGAIDQVTGENLWVSGYNGHANSVIGGAGPGAAASAENRARNIFTRTLRGSATLSKADPSAAVDMGLATHPTSTSRGFSYRSNSSDGTYEWNPPTGANTTAATATQLRSTAFQTFAWNTTISTTSTRNSTIATGTVQLTFQSNTAGTEAAHDAQANYHTFSCSKCHNPHASRLPKLMITNCLDTNHNTWEDNSTFTGGALPAPWTGLRHSQWASAQTCHRLDARATNNTTITVGKGWNTVTPWIEDTTPNTTLTGDITTQLAY